MKIIQLQAENIKRLKAVQISPTDDVVVISGKNENGKTSVIDSIWLALEYRAAVKSSPQPLRRGESKGIPVAFDTTDFCHELMLISVKGDDLTRFKNYLNKQMENGQQRIPALEIQLRMKQLVP